MDVASLIAALALVLTAYLSFRGIRREIRKDKSDALAAQKLEQEKALSVAVKAATDPIVRQLTDRTAERDQAQKDRDYWRNRADELQDDINEMNRKPPT